MDAIELLDEQHRDVERLFSQLESGRGDRRQQFRELADMLAIHATIEENHFYPAVKTEDTEEIVLESLEEHLAVKRLLADLLKLSVDEEEFKAKLTVLQEQVQMHVKEEREELFPKVRQLLDGDQREAIGQIMIGTVAELQGKAPRMDVPLQTLDSAPLKEPEQATQRVGLLGRLMTPALILAKAIKGAALGAADAVREVTGQRRRPRHA
jgi:hemerythrin superfamily protein